VPETRRATIKTQVEDRLRAEILGHVLPPGERIGEVEVADRLGVSRTPVREALQHLERDGLVESIPFKGFRIAPLQTKAVREVYSVTAVLECFALREGWQGDPKCIENLKSINMRLADESISNEVFIGGDAEWHATLVHDCRNSRLREMIAGLWLQTRRYDYVYVTETARRGRSHLEHNGILAALESGDMDGATGQLEQHWANSSASLVEAIEKISHDGA
jgi:DNA-binding GntR family transcriptional regulator